ncbi:MAG: HNH endonuclease [Blastocatellia bacterium]
MKTDRVSATPRKTVCIRAEGHYEYCHTPADYVPGSFAIEHIIPKSKGGKIVSSNLALSCPACNAHKYNKLECADPLNQKTLPPFQPAETTLAGPFHLERGLHTDHRKITGRTRYG